MYLFYPLAHNFRKIIFIILHMHAFCKCFFFVLLRSIVQHKKTTRRLIETINHLYFSLWSLS